MLTDEFELLGIALLDLAPITIWLGILQANRNTNIKWEAPKRGEGRGGI